ncbi:uncharacterized protein BYT42DRAFT_610208 [Radiomyces spectabilis]|uniref:uncharacterized protein n=1 Tax=Radiomyces spectabilis TaxID=64574 RepID=UPI0022202DD0|nr:uncharacterized protein BYT42DRAFT_610208 [Radiomyces spectabilis]KAI8390939.1 hypothetical protein BYT42DRAFT_610208 [Radiomyces spectabilis]
MEFLKPYTPSTAPSVRPSLPSSLPTQASSKTASHLGENSISLYSSQDSLQQYLSLPSADTPENIDAASWVSSQAREKCNEIPTQLSKASSTHSIQQLLLECQSIPISYHPPPPRFAPSPPLPPPHACKPLLSHPPEAGPSYSRGKTPDRALLL